MPLPVGRRTAGGLCRNLLAGPNGPHANGQRQKSLSWIVFFHGTLSLQSVFFHKKYTIFCMCGQEVIQEYVHFYGPPVPETNFLQFPMKRYTDKENCGIILSIWYPEAADRICRTIGFIRGMPGGTSPSAFK